MHGILSPGGISTEGRISLLVSFLGGPDRLATPGGLSGLILVISAAITARLVCQYLQGVVTAVEASSLETRLRIRIFEHLVNLSPSYFDREPAGKLGTLLNQVSSAVSQGLQIGRTAFTSLLMGFSYTVILFFLSWRLTLLTIVFILAAAWLARWTGGLVHVFSRKALEDGLKQRARSFDILSNIKLVKSSGTEERERERFERKERENEKQLNQTVLLRGLAHPLQEWIVTLSLAFFLITNLWVLPAKNSYPVVTLLMSLLLWQRGARVVMQIASGYTQFMMLAPSLILLAELLRSSAEPKRENHGIPFQELREGLVFQNVSMAYDKKEVLQGVSFTLPKGEILAVVGPSGAGKTTLAELLLRFYEFQKGNILVDGVDLRCLDIKSLREKIGLVSQETMILHDTIYHNIAYARPEAALEEVHEAAKKARLHERILAMAQGYETLVGDKGTMLSGGELQRLAIARTFLKNPEILILDEATNSLDLFTEEAIQEDLVRLMLGRTVIVISHHFSAIQRAQHLLFLQEGRVAECGSPRTLLEKKGKFYALWIAQQKGFEREEDDGKMKKSLKGREFPHEEGIEKNLQSPVDRF